MAVTKGLSNETAGAWIVHHGQKIATSVGGAAEFSALDTAAKAASLLSQLSSTAEATLEKARVDALAKAANLNPKTELPSLLKLLKDKRWIDVSATGAVTALGLTSRGTLAHANEIFSDSEPTSEEKASIEIAELSSQAPIAFGRAAEFISDQFKLPSIATKDFLARAEAVGFIDTEGADTDKLIFNGNLFRRDNVAKARRVLESLKPEEQAKALEVDSLLSSKGCVIDTEIERILTQPLFDKLRAAGVYDVNVVNNPNGNFVFITKPSAFHKFVDPLVDDAFDLAKALVAALTFGMTQSTADRGRITMIAAILNKLIAGYEVGPATAIGEDYKVLELKGVIKVKRDRYGYSMRLLKKDIGELAKSVLLFGDGSNISVLDRALPGKMTGYVGPEQSRQTLRKVQTPVSKRHTEDVLNALRTEGGL